MASRTKTREEDEPLLAMRVAEALKAADELADCLESLMNVQALAQGFNLDEDRAALAAYRKARDASK